MPIFFSSSPMAFWDTNIHSNIPTDAVEISNARHQELLAGQSSGKRIAADDIGRPILVDPPALPAAVPVTVSRFQARQALRQAGLLDAAEAAIAQASQLVRDAWADTVEWRRDSPTIAAMATALGLSPAQVDDLFRKAATITA